MKDSSKDSGKIVVAALAGAAVGAAVGMLMAPNSGRETLNGINKKVNSLKDTLNESVKNYAEMGKEKFSDVTGSSNGNGSHSNGSNKNTSGSSSKKSSNSANTSI